MRVFIGIELSEPVKNALLELQQQATPASVKGRFTDKDNFHLTLQFIGEANQKEIEQLRSVVAETASKAATFETTIDVLNRFQKKKGLILWVGPNTADPLLQLYHQLHATMIEFGYAIEQQTYIPHITLGRNIAWKEDKELPLNNPLDRPIPLLIDNLTLFESVRVNNRLMYRPFVRYPLKSAKKSDERKEE